MIYGCGCNGSLSFPRLIASSVTLVSLNTSVMCSFMSAVCIVILDGSRPRGRPNRSWREVVQKDCQARKLNRDDAIDRSRWKKLIMIG